MFEATCFAQAALVDDASLETIEWKLFAGQVRVSMKLGAVHCIAAR